ncbi:MAG: hypothetical protein JXJ19_01745 [Elusimicrobia bacterium]|nr:hypothetical protein [Elusimicrobiota bacterium]
MTVGGPAKTITILNNYIFKVTQTAPVRPADPVVPPQGRKSGNKLLETLFLTLQSVVLTNERFLILLMIFLAGAVIRFTGISGAVSRSDESCYVKHYRSWILWFMTPVQKCMEGLAARYDVNPSAYLEAVKEKKSPHHVLKDIMRGFFLRYDHE